MLPSRDKKQLTHTIARQSPHDPLVRYQHLHDWMQRWHWPNQVAGAATVFETGSFQASACETLSAAPVLKKYFRDIALPMATEQLEAPMTNSILACDVVEIIGAVNQGATPELLDDAVTAWETAHVASYGDATWVFKHQQPGHLVKMWKKFGMWPNCYTMERKHKASKRVCTDHLDTKSYEQAVMEDITLDCIHSQQAWRRHGPLNPRECEKTKASGNPDLPQA